MTARGELRRFVDAVRGFSEDPGPANLERYLAASRALKESKRPGRTTPHSRLALQRSPERKNATASTA
jgi:hypothetical protein